MTELYFPIVSAVSAGDYVQLLFDNSLNGEDDYFLIQTQFESYDGGYFYIESHERSLCGHFKIRRAELRGNALRLEFVCLPARTVQIRFEADGKQYDRLRRFLKIMIPSRILKIE